MELLLAFHYGPCRGVKGIVELIKQELKKGKKVFLYKDIVHNKKFIGEIEALGVKTIRELDEFEQTISGTIITRLHGITPEEFEALKRLDLEIIDGTCNPIKGIYKLAKKAEGEGYRIILFGKSDHAETVGILSRLKNPILIEKLEDASKVDEQKVALFSQTTMDKATFEQLKIALKDKVKELKVFNTICNETVCRQDSIIELAKRCDLVIIIGDKKSSNTLSLQKLAAKYCEAILAEDEKEITSKLLSGKKIVGVSAGASAPLSLIEICILKLKKLSRE